MTVAIGVGRRGLTPVAWVTRGRRSNRVLLVASWMWTPSVCSPHSEPGSGVGTRRGVETSTAGECGRLDVIAEATWSPLPSPDTLLTVAVLSICTHTDLPFTRCRNVNRAFCTASIS